MKTALIGLAAMTMVSVPAFADHTPTLGQRFSQGMTKENVGRAVGATVGALVGSQIGGGRGKLAAVAGGTVAGYILGGKVGRNSAAKHHASSYRSQPVYTSGSVYKSTPRVQARRTSFKPPLTSAPPLEMIDSFYIADTKSNVRGGPGTDYLVVDQLNQGEQVAVIGKVMGQDWYMVSENGVGTGFVYAPLLSPLPNYSSFNTPTNFSYNRTAFNTPNYTMPQNNVNQGFVQQNRCSVFTQQITLPDGTPATRNIEACQRADGSWEEA